MISLVLASIALLQTAAPSANIPSMIFTYGAIFAIFYFVLLRPQQKQKKLHQNMVNNLKKGDEVATAGGIVGEVMHIAQQSKETKDGTPVASFDDRITIKSGESRLIIERGRITRVTSGSGASSTTTAS